MAHRLKKLLFPLSFALAAVAFLVAPTKSEARVRIPIPYTSGAYYIPAVKLESIREILPSAPDQAAVLYWKCDHHFGLLWTNIAMFGCHIVALKPEIPDTMEALDNSESAYRYDLPKETTEKLEKAFPFSETKRGFWFTYGRWFLLLGIAVAAVFYGLSSSKTDGPADSDPDHSDGAATPSDATSTTTPEVKTA